MSSFLGSLHLWISNIICKQIVVHVPCNLIIQYVHCRVEFVPCNKQDYYVIEIHVKPGERNEIYSDGDDKVNVTFTTHYTPPSCSKYSSFRVSYGGGGSTLVQFTPLTT